MIQKKLSLVIPCYNESKNLPGLITRLGEVITRPDIEVILVDNGSTDDSPTVLAQHLPQFPLLRTVRVEVNQGYGFGILAGLRAATGEYIGWTHADLQTDPADAVRALELIEKNTTSELLFVKGQRYGRPFGDVLFTVGMSIFESVILRVPLWDINAQPTIFPKTFFERWRNSPHDFSLDLYAFYQARRNHLTVRRFPVRFGERLHGHSHWNINWQAKYKFIKRTIDFTFRLKRELTREMVPSA